MVRAIEGLQKVMRLLPCFLTGFILMVSPAACVPAAPAESEPTVLRLATTTSTADSGLLDAILPDFNRKYNARVDVIAVGTGQALAMGEKGDADVLLVHAPTREDKFVADGYAQMRHDVMYNDFIIVGPGNDPAGVKGMKEAAGAFARIAEVGAGFASRGDDSGTHIKERALWRAAGLEPGADDAWYKSLGQGMGSTLIFANEDLDYTLADRGTYLAMRTKLPNLVIMVGGETIAENTDAGLRNPYGVLPLNPDRFPWVDETLAQQLVDWMISVPVQDMIGEYGIEEFGQPLFYPNSQPYRLAQGEAKR